MHMFLELIHLFKPYLKLKISHPKNCEYFLADILQNPLGKKKFDLIVALNMFELVEPSLLLKTMFSNKFQMDLFSYLILMIMIEEKIL